MIRLYRALLWLLPPAFRREYGEVMTDAVRELAFDASRVHGGGAFVGTGPLAFGDLAMTIGREWKDELSMSRRDLLVKLAGLSAIAGAVGWFTVFIGPQWGFVPHGYRPNAIMMTSLALAIGLIAVVVRQRNSWSRLRLVGMVPLIASVIAAVIQAPGAMGGVSFDFSGSGSSRGLAVHLLPLAISLLAIEWALPGAAGFRIWVALRLIPGVLSSVLAVALLFPAQTGWFDLWDFVFRYAYVFPAVWIAIHEGYRMLGGPSVQVHLVRAGPRAGLA